MIVQGYHLDPNGFFKLDHLIYNGTYKGLHETCHFDGIAVT